MAAMTRPAGSAGLVLFAEVLNLRNLGPAAMVGYGNDSDSFFLCFPDFSPGKTAAEESGNS